MNNKSKKKSKAKYIFGAIVLILVVSILSMTFLRRNEIYAYDEDVVKTSDIQTYYNFSGTVESKNSTTMAAEKAMQISEVLVKEGDNVNKDDVLFRTTQDDEINAKISGTITSLYAQEGMAVMSGAKLCDIMDLSNLQIKIKVDEYDLSCIKEGGPVLVKIDALDKNIQGSVSSVSKIAVSNNGLSYFTAIVNLDPDDSIKVGMNAEAVILNEEAKGALTIPMKAIQFEKETNTPYVYIKNDKDKPVKQVISVGINDGMNVQVLSGLSEGEQIYYKDTTSSLSNQPMMMQRMSGNNN